MLTTSTKHTPKQSLSEQLSEVKQLLMQAIPVHLKSPHLLTSSSAQNNPMTVLIPEYKHMKRNELIQQNAVLGYQVKLLCNLIMKLGIDEDSPMYQLNQSQTNQEIQLREENRNLIAKISKMEKQMQKMTKDKQELQEQLVSAHKNDQIYRKKMSQVQKIGGMTKFNQLKDKISQLQNKQLQNIKQASAHKEQIKKLKQKCKVLEQLNNETQQKLSQALVQINIKKSQAQDSHNKQNINNNNNANAKMELMASKEQIRVLKQRIETLVKQKQNLKNRHTEKECLYQKMIMRKETKLV